MKRVYFWLSLAVFFVVAGAAGYLGYLLWSKTNDRVAVSSNYQGIASRRWNSLAEIQEYTHLEHRP